MQRVYWEGLQGGAPEVSARWEGVVKCPPADASSSYLGLCMTSTRAHLVPRLLYDNPTLVLPCPTIHKKAGAWFRHLVVECQKKRAFCHAEGAAGGLAG
jgi:hypothetical protein